MNSSSLFSKRLVSVKDFSTFRRLASHCFSQVILPDGDFSEGYDILSGVRQGDCISPLFFVLTIDMLIRAILNCREINGFKIPYHYKSILQPHNGEVLPNKIVGFADDLSLAGSREDLEPALKVIDLYCRASGAKVNFNKSTVTLKKKGKRISVSIVFRLTSGPSA